MKKILRSMMMLLLVATGANAQSVRTNVDAQDYPFTLTTDAENPSLYYIYSGRDGGGAAGKCVFSNEIPWGHTEQKLVLSYPNPYNPDPMQLWYFMEAENGQIKIISAADGRMVTVADTQDGAKKVYMQTEEERTNEYYTWTLDKTGGYYGFKTSDGKNFLSHNGGWSNGGPQMGLYNADGAKDDGTRVFFEAVATPASIAGVNINKTQQDGIYTIAGRRIQHINTPGIYIVNGVKCVVR